MPLPPSLRRFREESGHIRLAELVGAAHFPVYGLDGHPLGLTFGREVGYSGIGNLLSSVTLSFAYPATGEVSRSIAVTSARPADSWVIAPADWVSIPLDTPLYGEDSKLFARHRTVDDARHAGITDAHLLIDHLPIADVPFADVPFAARLQFWSRPDPEWRVTLRQPEQLDGDTIFCSVRGLAGNELLTLLEQLIAINHRGDLLARYQTEHEQRRIFG